MVDHHLACRSQKRCGAYQDKKDSFVDAFPVKVQLGGRLLEELEDGE